MLNKFLRAGIWNKPLLNGFIFLFINIYGLKGQECNQPLGLQSLLIPDEQIHASSWTPGRSDPWYGRLGNESKKSWCSTTLDTNQFLQIDYGPNMRRFTAVGSQGSHNYDHWVSSYTLSFSNDGFTWTKYKKSGVEKVFVGNTDKTTIVKHPLNEPITAVYLRFHPKTWNVEMCMRVEAFGCDAFYHPLGLENGSVPDAKLKSRSSESHESAKYARLNHAKALRSPASNIEFLEVNLGESLKVVTAIATQGHGSREEWVKYYTLSYSADGAEWFDCKEHGEQKMFEGNSDQHTVVKHVLAHNITALVVRFHLLFFKAKPSIRVEIYGGEVCSEPFGMEHSTIPDSSISATAIAGPGKEAKNARLNGAAAWCGLTNQDYLQIDLGRVRKLHKLATQGHPSLKHWVPKYFFHYSLDNVHWYQYEPVENQKECIGNTDQNTIVYTKLNKIRRARYVKFQPKEWNASPCMRVELYGCEDCSDPVGLERSLISDSALSASSWYDIDYEPWLGRLYETRGEKVWCAKTNDGNQYLQVDLGHVTKVTGVATQGRNRHSWWGLKQPAWVTAYKLSSSNYTFVWTVYKEDGVNDKVFTGNSASNDVIRHALVTQIVTRYLRFVPTTWQFWTCMRVEVYGCKDCDNPLGMDFYHIKREAILDSSGVHINKAPSNYMARAARLNYEYYRSWVPNKNKEHSYLQIDLGIERVVVTAVAAQGNAYHYAGAYEYTLSFSTDRLEWFDYREEWKTKILTAKKSRYQATKRYLKHKIITRYIRFWPKRYVDFATMRVEVYGCRGCSQLLSLLEPGVVNSTKFFTGSNISMVSWTRQTRLNDNNPVNTWCGSQDGKQFFRFNFGSLKEIRSVYLQGHPNDAKWVTKISFRYSTDGIFFKKFSGYYNKQIFEGNTDQQNITVINLNPKLVALILDVYPKEWNTAPCMRIEVFGEQDCVDPIGMANYLIPNEDITATSWISIDTNPSQARLHNTHGQGAWCSKLNDAQQFLEIKLSRPHHVSRVATQGRFPVPGCEVGDAWVTQYSIEYSEDGYSWCFYQENGINKVFTANQEFLNVVVNKLLSPILALKVRIRPVQWNQRICLRVELYGCKGFFKPLGMENNDITDPNIMAQKLGNEKNFRLNSPYMPTFTKTSRTEHGSDHFLTIDMGHIPFIVTGIAMQGSNINDYYLIGFVLSLSLDGGEWFDYIEDGETKVISANKYQDNIGIVIKQLKYKVKARSVRITVKLYSRTPSFRTEIYGYPVDNAPLGMSTGQIPDSAITASSFSPGYEPAKGRLIGSGNNNWCANSPIVNEFIKVDVGRVVVITQIAVGGGLPNGDGRVSNYSLSHSIDGEIWEVYTESEFDNKVFAMNSNTFEAVKKSLRFPFRARFIKVYPIHHTGSVPCLTLEVYGKEDCKDSIGISDWKVPKSAITASSWISANYMPWMARIDSRDFGGAWCARYNNVEQFLQVDLGSLHKIKQIQIQGKETKTDLPTIPESWVLTFTISYGKDGYSWKKVLESNDVKIFEGNTNGHDIKTVAMTTEVNARFLRVHPMTWQNHICLRIELIGCEECGEALGMENYKIPRRALHASTFDGGHKPYLSRLKRDLIAKFCTAKTIKGEFLQIDVGRAGKVVSGVAIQGAISFESYLVEFTIQYSRDGITYQPYKVNGKEKIFKGSPGRYEIIKHRFEHRIIVTNIRIVAKEFIARVCFRAELYGCEACNELRGFGSHLITSYTLSASSNGPTVDNAKVSILNKAWCATSGDSAPFLQAQFTSVEVITKIFTMGHPVSGVYVSKYKLEYSMDGSTWNKYYEDSTTSDVTNIINRERSLAEGHTHELQFPITTKFLKIVLDTSVGLCMKTAFYGHEVCKLDLGMEDSRIPDSSLSASSSASLQYSPANARLNHHLGNGAWCANKQIAGQYLQVDLKILHRVKSVALQAKTKTQASHDVDAWVKKFYLKHSRDGSQWNKYYEDGVLKEFPGITDTYETVRNDLKNDIIARYVQIVVTEWEARICMRIELYGCKACLEPLGMENYQLAENMLSASEHEEVRERGRLGSYKSGFWHSAAQEQEIFYQINLGSKIVVTGIATQGRRGGHGIELQQYNIQYSNDGTTWTNYTENQTVKSFSGYAAEQEVVQHYLSNNIAAQYIRFLPKVWLKKIELKTELYGCKVIP